MRIGDTIRLVVESLSFGGDSVARLDGRVVFLDGGGPGDEVDARAWEVKARFARAHVVAVTRGGPARVAPRCPLVARCGGCQWQEVALDEQRRAKQAIVERALGRLGCEVRPILGATEPFAYRSRARFTVGEDGALGFAARRSHEIVDVASCPLLDPALDRALAAIREAIGGRARAGATVSLLVGRGGAVHAAIEGLSGDGAALLGLAGRAPITGVSVDGRRAGDELLDTGDDGEAAFSGSAAGFAQASHAGNRALRRVVTEEMTAGGAPARVLELYAGDGNFTRDVARYAKEIVAVEGERSAAGRISDNARGPARVTALGEPAEQAVRRLAAEGARFDAVLLDPPRAGAAALAPLLAALAPRVVYVSCDPMTLARDARTLSDGGLRPRRATPLDLMPHTFHVETVCRFDRDG